MEVAVLITRLVLASILVIASGAKLINQPGTRQSLLDFGVARSWTPLLSLLLPLSELSAAVLLLWPGTSWYGAISALFLILIFTAAIAYNLAIGRRPACGCFGQLRSGRIGRGTIVRNMVLCMLAASIVILDRGAPAMFHSRTAVVTSLALLALLVILLALIFTLVWRSLHTRSTTDREGRGQEATAESLPIGSAAPSFSLSSMDDRESSLTELLASGSPLVVFFLSSDCRPCFALIPQLNLWKHELGRRCSLVVITKGTSEANRMMFTKAKIDAIIPVLVDRRGTVAEAYKVRWTPAALLLSPNGEIRSELAFGAEKITALLDELIESGCGRADLTLFRSR